jgi:hypothetical protein
MQFRFAHRSFETQQETIIEVCWIIHAVFIKNERVGQSADLQQPVPVGGVSRQAGNFQAQHDASFAQADFGNQLLKPFPIHSRGAGLPEIGVDDDDVLHGPAQGDGMLAQTVLSLGAFGIFKNLTKRRLAHIKDKRFA